MIEACYTCEKTADTSKGESLDCKHKHYRFSEENKNRIKFLESSKELRFGELA